jgi:hypothetical protein
VPAALVRYFWGAGHVSGAGGVSIGTRGKCASAVSLSPARSLAAHWPAGMNSWMNANAGAAVAPTNSSDAAVTATSVLLTLRTTVSFHPYPQSMLVYPTTAETSDNSPSSIELSCFCIKRVASGVLRAAHWLAVELFVVGCPAIRKARSPSFEASCGVTLSTAAKRAGFTMDPKVRRASATNADPRRRGGRPFMRRVDRRTTILVAIVVALWALTGLAGPVGATSPQQVTIVSHVTFNPDGPNYGDFTASGDAVESGLICESGTFVDTAIRFAGYQSDRGTVQILVIKQFTCDDGSGTFTVKLQIQANFDTGIESFTWVVLGGTGDYASLHGSGQGSTVPNPPVGNINTYQGFLT